MTKSTKSRGSSVAVEDRAMTLAEVATYLHMGQKSVLALAQEGQIPGKQIEKEWRFLRSAIDQWLAAQSHDEDLALRDVPDGMRLPLGDLLVEAGIVHDMKAKDAISVIEELAGRAWTLKYLKDKPWFVGALVEREALASTAMEGGVAFLHTRSRDTERVNRPFVIVGRSFEGVAFGAPDGKPTYLFFLLGLKYDKLHLPILGRLARIMTHNHQMVTRLRAGTTATKIRSTLLQLDSDELAGITRAVEDAPARDLGADRQNRLRAIMRINAQRQYDAKKVYAAANPARKTVKTRKKK